MLSLSTLSLENVWICIDRYVAKKIGIREEVLEFLAEKVVNQIAERNYQLEITALQVFVRIFRLKMLQKLYKMILLQYLNSKTRYKEKNSKKKDQYINNRQNKKKLN